MQMTETTMTKREANQQRSLEAFLAKKAEFDALIAELQQASGDHFGADPEAVETKVSKKLEDLFRENGIIYLKIN